MLWSSQEEEAIARYYAIGYGIKDIANMMDRTERSISIKASKMGLISKAHESYFKQIKAYVAMLFYVEEDELFVGTRGKTNRFMAKHMVRALLKENTALSLSDIGRITGRAGHDTVINSIKKHNNFMDTDKHYRRKFELTNSEIKPDMVSEFTILIKRVKSGLLDIDSKIAFNELITNYL